MQLIGIGQHCLAHDKNSKSCMRVRPRRQDTTGDVSFPHVPAKCLDQLHNGLNHGASGLPHITAPVPIDPLHGTYLAF